MKIATTIDERGIALIEVQGEIDAQTAGDLEKALDDLLAQGRSRLALDFSQVGYISSSGLRILLRAQQEASKLDGEVRLFGLNTYVLKVFQMTGFHRVLPIVSTRQEAVEGW